MTSGAYAAALAAHGFRPCAGQDASGQPPDIPDVLLHETVAGWVRKYMKKHPARRTNDIVANEAAVKLATRECVQLMRRNYKVHDLCGSFSISLKELVEKQGERLPH